MITALDKLCRWLGGVDHRAPDFTIGPAGAPYMRRWWVIPRNPWFNIYYHEILHSDDDRALHDHMYVNMSVVLAGGYCEITPVARLLRQPGTVVVRRPTALHRLELIDGRVAHSLFITGPRVRNWGFMCPKGWVPWQEFVKADAPGSVGRGCN